jgi:hypothetical protein
LFRHYSESCHDATGKINEADEYRRKGFEAQRQAGLAADPVIKDGWQLLGQEWLALAEQIEWIERRIDIKQRGLEFAPDSQSAMARSASRHQCSTRQPIQVFQRSARERGLRRLPSGGIGRLGSPPIFR